MKRTYKKPQIESYAASDILEEMGPCQNQYGPPVDATFYTVTGNSGGNVDGHVYFAGTVGFGNTEVSIGDTNVNEPMRGFAGFDISSLAGRSVVSATLRMHQQSVVNNPYTGGLGNLIVDHVNFGDSLTADDYGGGTLASDIGTLSTNTDLEWKTLDVAARVQNDVNAGRTTSQFRLRFSITDMDGDWTSEWVRLYAAEWSTERPELVVTYQ